tara:strand:- start:4945 stop:5220 length:276 start_codon:yes stop_codon:yes gene_type:complete
MNVTKKIISRKVSENLSINMSVSNDFLDKFINLIKENSINRAVKIKNFGTFKNYKSKKRLGRNPKTKQSYIIPTMNKIIFVSSNVVKKEIN